MADQRHDPKDLRMMPFAWSEESVLLGGVVEVPRWFDVRLEHPDWPTLAVLNVVVDPDTGPVATGLRGDRTSPTTFREVVAMISATADLDALLREATAQATGLRSWSRVRDQLPADVELTDELRAKYVAIAGEVAARVREVPPVQRRRRMTMKFLREVAEVYRKAQDAGEPPTMAVAKHFNVAHRTATRWASEARNAGVLGPAGQREEEE